MEKNCRDGSASFQAEGRTRAKVQRPELHGVFKQRVDGAGRAVSEGRVEGGEVWENSSVQITYLLGAVKKNLHFSGVLLN